MSCNGSSGPLFLVNCIQLRQSKTNLKSHPPEVQPFWKVWCGSSTANSFRSFFFGICFQEIEFMSTRVRYSKALDGTDYIPGCIGWGLSEIPTSWILRSFEVFFLTVIFHAQKDPKGPRCDPFWSWGLNNIQDSDYQNVIIQMLCTAPRIVKHGLVPLNRYRMIEGSLEVKLPTIWTDEKQIREEAERRERSEERRVEEKE